MQGEAGYYRHPTIHGDSIAFACEDDLWCVAAAGGVARRLTASPGATSFPAYSPDGAWIAYTGRDEGPSEVYVMEAEGGPARRLTWHGAMSQVVGWRPDGRAVLYASDWRQPFHGYFHLYSVPLAGGAPEELKLGPVRAISLEPAPGRGVVIGRNTGDPARWKRYRGGTAGALWIDRAGTGEFAPLLRLPGNLAGPMWIGGRIYFLSDHEGFGNLYSCTPTGRDLRRHTHHEDFYVRFPATDGSRIVYQAGGDLYLHDVAPDRTKKLDVATQSPRSQSTRKFVSASRYQESFDLHPAGHSIAVVARGGVYTMGLWEGAAKRLGPASAVRHRLATWLADGQRLVAVSDEGGEDGLVVIRAADGEVEKRIDGDVGRPVELVAAPAGADWVALANQRQEVIVVDLASGRVAVVERSKYARIEGLAWSPDGRWLAYGFPDSLRTISLHLCDVTHGKISAITRSEFRDIGPAFDPEGKYLYFISWRTFDPVYDSHYFDLGFPRGARPYLIPLQRDLASPFAESTRALRAPGAPAATPEGAQKSEGDGKDGKDPAGAAAKPGEGAPALVSIDLEGIADRVVAFPVPEGRYGRILGARGRVLFSSYPIEGSLDAAWIETEPKAAGILLAYDFTQDKAETVLEGITDFQLSKDAKALAIRAGNRIRVVPAAWKAEGRGERNGGPGRESGWLDLERLRVSVVPSEEWRQMFREAWRLQRDQFWTSDMSGIDWVAVYERYLPLVDRVASRAEFSDLMWELQGELGTSHCYELGGDYRPEPAWYQGRLGADIVFDRRRGAWRIARIPRGDSWDERYSSPLAAPGLNIREGDEILAVAGQAVDSRISPDERLVHYAGQHVELTIRAAGTTAPGRGAGRRGAAAGVRTVTVKTLAAETALRYRAWVEANRARVHAATGGRVGYVHVPDMGARGYSEFHRAFLHEVYRDGLIVDVRWNGGGHVSQLILEKLLRRRIGYDPNRWGQPYPYPIDSPAGPIVALTNEYAGSDGDIFSHSFKLYGLGPLIGKRTWGGVVGIWPRHMLVDGTVTTQPEFASWFEDVGWGVENYGTDPDIEVEIRPQDHAAGKDPQLERGLVEIARLLRRKPPKLPTFGNRPLRRPGRLGPPAVPGTTGAGRRRRG